MRWGKIAALTSILMGGLSAQPLVTRPAFDAFEVATIKPTPPDWRGGTLMGMRSAHQLIARSHTLKSLVQSAYDLPNRAVTGGPAWIDSERYDIVAEAPNEIRPNLDEQMSMLRALLGDRFKLSFHRERKEFSIFTLNVAKSGPKLKESTASPDATPTGPSPLTFNLSPGNARLTGRNASMTDLASVMKKYLFDRPVVDQTGLLGKFDITLQFTPDEDQFGGMGLHSTPESTQPDLFTAIQEQLGLRLEATRGPIDTLVIDRVERPSEN